MRDADLERDFPRLLTSTYKITSPHDPKYNCVAYAVGDTTHFWYDVQVKGYYWPPGVPSADTVEGWVKLFTLHGYTETDDASLEPEYEKVAIYASIDGPEHVARSCCKTSRAPVRARLQSCR